MDFYRKVGIQEHMKRIVFVIPNMTGGGTERVISLLSDQYIRMGYEVSVMQFAGYQHAYELNGKVEDFSVAPQSHKNPFTMLKRIAAMRSYYKKHPDCYIFAFCVNGTIFSVLATLGRKRHLLVAERSSPLSCKEPHLRNWAYGYADKIAFQTPDGIRFFPKKLAEKAVVIPNAVAEDVPERYPGKRSKRIASVGRLGKEKNHRLLLDAFALFLPQMPEYELHLYGEGELEQELKTYAEVLGISGSVYWHGFCPDVKREIVDFGMFVLPSDYEGISNSMVEALGMGIPTIATDCPIGGARTYIQDGVNGLLVPVGNREAMAEAMLKIASDEAFAGRLSVNAARIKEQYSMESVARQFLEAAGIDE